MYSLRLRKIVPSVTKRLCCAFTVDAILRGLPAETFEQSDLVNSPEASSGALFYCRFLHLSPPFSPLYTLLVTLQDSMLALHQANHIFWLKVPEFFAIFPLARRTAACKYPDWLKMVLLDSFCKVHKRSEANS